MVQCIYKLPDGTGPHLALRGNLVVFRELRQDAWGSSRVEKGHSVAALVASEKTGLFLSCEGAHLDSSRFTA